VIRYKYKVKGRPEIFHDFAESEEDLAVKHGRKVSEHEIIGASNEGERSEAPCVRPQEH